MRSTEELPGTLVLIRSNELPEVHNEIGTILSELIDGGTVIVNLNGDLSISFSVHELFVLRTSEEIEKDALLDHGQLPFWEYNDIIEAAMFANNPKKNVQRVAIEASRNDPAVFEYTMSSLAEELGLNRSQQISR